MANTDKELIVGGEFSESGEYNYLNISRWCYFSTAMNEFMLL